MYSSRPYEHNNYERGDKTGSCMRPHCDFGCAEWKHVERGERGRGGGGCSVNERRLEMGSFREKEERKAGGGLEIE